VGLDMVEFREGVWRRKGTALTFKRAKVSYVTQSRSLGLADLPVDQNVFKDPGGRFHDNSERYVTCFLREIWGATKPVQNTANSRANKTGDLSEAVDGREGCDEKRSSDCSVRTSNVPHPLSTETKRIGLQARKSLVCSTHGG